MEVIPIIDLGISFLQSFLGGMKNKLPAEIVTSVQAVIDQLAAHKDDVISKANLEANRG